MFVDRFSPLQTTVVARNWQQPDCRCM